MSASISTRIAAITVARRTALFILASLVTLTLATGILRTDFDTSLTALLTQSDPYLDEFDLFQQEFPNQLEVYYSFVAGPGLTVFDQTVLNAISSLESQYQDIPGAERLSSLVNYYSPEQQQRLFTKPLADYSQPELNTLRAVAVQDRLLTANLLSRDASLSTAIVSIDAEAASNAQRIDIANAVLAVRDRLRTANPELGIYANSDVLFEQSSQQAMIDDLTSLLPLIILVCVLVICYCFRSIVLGACILIHVLFTALTTIGALGYLGFSFNTISIIAPLVVVIIAVANSVHIISIYRQALHRQGSRIDAMRHSVAYNFRPITLAALTTAIGFSSLNMCSSPAIQDFGQIVAVGIVFAYLLTLIMLPFLLVKFSGALAQAEKQQPLFLQNSLERIIDLTRQHDKAIFWSCSGLALLTLALLPLNETDFNRLDFIAADSDIREYYDAVGEHMNRGPALVYAIDTELVDGAIEPEFLLRLEAFKNWLEAETNVESAASVVDVVKTVGRAANQNDQAYYVIPSDIDTVAYYLNSYEVVESPDFPLSSFINGDFSIVTLFVNATPMSNQSVLDLDARISAHFEAEFGQAQLIHGSGLLLFARMDEMVTIELLQGYSISLLLITLTLVVGLRSLYYGVLSILPNLLPASIVFGFWGLFVGQLDPFVMMLFSISIGLVVDDTVHILSHYLEGRQAGASTEEAVAHAIKVAGPALTITTLVLALGTTFLIFANTLYFQQSAKLLVPIVIIALLLDLLYLPTILKRCDRRRPAKLAVTS